MKFVLVHPLLWGFRRPVAEVRRGPESVVYFLLLLNLMFEPQV